MKNFQHLSPPLLKSEKMQKLYFKAPQNLFNFFDFIAEVLYLKLFSNR